MNRFSKGKRVLSLLLAMVLLISMLPPIAVPVYSETPDDVPATEDFKKYIGCNAWLAGYTTPLAVAPENVSDPLTNECVQFDASDATALKLVIVDCYYNEKNDTLWYKVKAAPGYELPEAVAAAPWVFQDYVANPWGESLIVSEPKTVTGAVTDSEGNPVLDSNGEPLKVTVSGGLPAGAELKVTVPEISGEKHGNVFDIKMLAPDENGEMIEWQPIDEGRVVTILMPVLDAQGFGYVNINHFIDYTGDINGDENIVDISEATDEELALLNPAIEAYGDGTHVAIEVVERKKVSNGMVQVKTDSFSLFTEVESPPTEVSTYVIEELNGQKLFVRPGEWFRLTTNQSALLVEGWDAGNAESDGTIRTIAGGGSRFLFWGSSENSFYVFTNENNSNNQSTVGSTYTISFTHTVFDWPLYKTYTVDVEVVEDFDWGSTYITLLPHTAGYPSEPSVYSDKGYQFFVGDTLGNSKNVYTMYPRNLIDVDALNDADVESDVDRLVYGIADNTGKNTVAYLKDAFDAIATDMLAEYFVGKGTLIPENYKLVVYAIKHETVGDNAGWYIHCKVELKDKFNLSYAYNEPSGFKAQTHLTSSVKLPEGTSATPTIDEDTGKPTATVTVGNGEGMKMELPDGKTTYTATFVAWSTDPSADPDQYVEGKGGMFGTTKVTLSL